MKSNSIWRTTLVFIVLLFLGLLFVSAFAARNRVDIAQTEGDFWMPLEEPVSQTFVPGRDFLNIVIVSFKNPAIANETEYFFRLKKDGSVLREVAFSGKNVGDPAQVRFQFAPLENVAGKEVVMEIFPTEPPGEQPLLVRVARDNPYPGGKLNGTERDLNFFTYTRSANKTQALRSSLTVFLGRLTSDKIFFGFWVTILALLFAGGKWIKRR